MLLRMKAPTQGAVRDALRLYVDLQEHDHAARLRADLDRLADADVDQRNSLLQSRHDQSRIYAALNGLAAKHGRDCVYTPEIDAQLVEQGHSEFERDKIRHRLGHGYAKEVYTPGSAVAGTPPLAFIDDQLRQLKAPVTPEMRDWFLRHLAENHANIEAKSAKRYAEALGDFGKAYKTVPPQLPVDRNFANVDWPAPPFALADAVERGDFDVTMAGPFADAPIDAKARFGAACSAEAEPAPAETADDKAFGSSSPAPQAGPPTEPGVEPDAMAGEAPAVEATKTAVQLQPDERQERDLPPAPGTAVVPSGTTGTALTLAPPKPALFQTLPEMVEALITTRRDKKKWKAKTQRQVRALAKLYCAIAGTSDLARLSQSNVMDFFLNVAFLPKHYGQSSRARNLPIQELLERGAEIKLTDPDAVGLDIGTHNRYLSQLGSILRFARASGINIGDPATLADLRETDPRRDDEKSAAFTFPEMIKIFRHPTWTNLTLDVPPSLYWIPLLASYGYERLDELCSANRGDVNISKAFLVVLPNERRGLKNKESDRPVPFHREIVRLGFLQYVASLGGRPSEPLFPDLAARGTSSLANLFAKKWAPILKEVLPNAQAEMKSFKSFRSAGNTRMINTDVIDPIRESILGHAGKTINTRVYKKRKMIDISALRRAIEKFPCVTKHLTPRNWAVVRDETPPRRLRRPPPTTKRQGAPRA
jgi:integrase